jgi:hypothetical protein
MANFRINLPKEPPFPNPTRWVEGLTVVKESLETRDSWLLLRASTRLVSIVPTQAFIG